VGTSTTAGVDAILQTRSDSFGALNQENFYSAANSSPPNIIFAKSRGSAAAPAVVNSDDFLGIIRFRGHDGTDYETSAAEIYVQVDGTPGANDMPGRLVFSTTPDGSASPAERMRITSAGLVGLGTSSPGSNLQITRVTGDSLDIVRIGQSDGHYLGISRSNTTGAFSFQGSQTGNNNILLAPTSGSVGIGTTTPSTLLELAGVSNPQITLNGTATNAQRGLIFSYLGTAYGQIGQNVSTGEMRLRSGESGQSGYFITFGTNDGSERARIDSSGRLLVGTTTSLNSADFQISVGSGASSAPYAAIYNTAASPTSAASTRLDLGFLSGASNYVATNTVLGAINFMGQANDTGYGGAGISAIVTSGGNVARSSGHSIDLTFSTKSSSSAGYTERMRIDSSGRMLVGTSANSGGATIQASGSVQASIALRFPANSRNGATTKPTAIETISTDGGTNTATTYANNRYGSGKWVFLAGFDSSGNAIGSTTSTSGGATFVFCITDAATNFPTT